MIYPTSILPMKRDNYFAVSVAFTKRIVLIYWDERSPLVTLVNNQTGIEEDAMYATNSLNGSAFDPFGRYVAGTYRFTGCVANGAIDSNVYLIKRNGQIVRIISNVKTIGGIVWNKRKRLVYFYDSCDYNIREYQWDPKTGHFSMNSND